MIRISWGITVKDEIQEIRYLLSVLDGKIGPEDEIVILFDEQNGSQTVLDYLNEVEKEYGFRLFTGKFQGHFGEWKNRLTQYCSKDYIFQIDSDEYPHQTLLENIHDLIEQNENTDVILVPRVNTVEGITQEHINKWGWNVNSSGYVNYPDYQWRIYKNNGTIKWKNKVHEQLTGFKTYSTLPSYEELSLYHPKTIQRQTLQNDSYDKLMREK